MSQMMNCVHISMISDSNPNSGVELIKLSVLNATCTVMLITVIWHVRTFYKLHQSIVIKQNPQHLHSLIIRLICYQVQIIQMCFKLLCKYYYEYGYYRQISYALTTWLEYIFLHKTYKNTKNQMCCLNLQLLLGVAFLRGDNMSQENGG